MSGSEAQTIARALYDSLTRDVLRSLKLAAERQLAYSGDAEQFPSSIEADTPREVKNLVSVLARDGMLHMLPAVAQSFEHYTTGGAKNRLDAEIVSAVELDAAQRAHVTTDLQTRYGAELVMTFRVDPTLIGGLVIRVGDQVLDNSLRTRLSAVQRSMVTG